MSDYHMVRVVPETYRKLQRLALLAGSESAAIERLIACWEGLERLPSPDVLQDAEQAPQFWTSPSGDVLKVGQRLEGRYRGKSYFARVERDGIRLDLDSKLYDSPSAAAVAVKKAVGGLDGSSASTDGRTFWKVTLSGRLVSLREWMLASKLDPNKELEKMMAARP